MDRHGRLARRGRNPRRRGPPSAAARSHLSSRSAISGSDGRVSMEIRVEENPAEVVSGMLVDAAKAGGHMVLTGGSTPKLAYEMASRADVNWSDATVWFSDERCVPPESGLSNYRMANE